LHSSNVSVNGHSAVNSDCNHLPSAHLP